MISARFASDKASSDQWRANPVSLAPSYFGLAFVDCLGPSISTTGALAYLLAYYLRFLYHRDVKMTLARAKSADDFVDAASVFEERWIQVLAEFESELASGNEVAAAKALVPIITNIVDDLSQHIPIPLADQDLVFALAVNDGSEALFSGWTAKYGFARGTVAAIAVRLESHSAIRSTPLAVPAGFCKAARQVDYSSFTNAVRTQQRIGRAPLDLIRDALGLTTTELGAMFGVSRQAVDQWRQDGIPSKRLRAVGDALAVAELLERKLKPGHLPLTARKPAEAFGGVDLLEALAKDPAATRAAVEASFDWSETT